MQKKNCNEIQIRIKEKVVNFKRVKKEKVLNATEGHYTKASCC